MKIALLDVKSIGTELDYSNIDRIGDVHYYDYTEDSERYARLVDVDVAISNKVVYDEALLCSLEHLKLICVTGTGYNNVDVEVANRLGIAVCNVSKYCTESVAQHTFALVLALVNRINDYKEYVGTGQYIGDLSFKHFDMTFHELAAMKWGIIGLGDIGRSVANKAMAFGAKVFYYSTSGVKREESIAQVDFEKLLTESDIITIHAPLNSQTQNLINREQLKKIKKTAIIVNVGRGGIINEFDVVEAILNGEIGALGMDVLIQEPMTKDSPYIQVMNRSNVIITPHVAWASLEARQRVVNEVGKNIRAFLDGELRNRVV